MASSEPTTRMIQPPEIAKLVAPFVEGGVDGVPVAAVRGVFEGIVGTPVGIAPRLL